MTWNVYGKPYDSAIDTSIYQRMKFDDNVILKAIRVWLIFFNNPTLTSINAKIWTDASEAPGLLLHTSSNSQTKADMITLDYGVKETYFEFTNCYLRKETWFNFTLAGTGYSPAGGAHIAWKTSFPDPVYPEGVTQTLENLAKYPLCIYPIFSKVDET